MCIIKCKYEVRRQIRTFNQLNEFPFMNKLNRLPLIFRHSSGCHRFLHTNFTISTHRICCRRMALSFQRKKAAWRSTQSVSVFEEMNKPRGVELLALKWIHSVCSLMENVGAFSWKRFYSMDKHGNGSSPIILSLLAVTSVVEIKMVSSSIDRMNFIFAARRTDSFDFVHRNDGDVSWSHLHFLSARCRFYSIN